MKVLYLVLRAIGYYGTILTSLSAVWMVSGTLGSIATSCYVIYMTSSYLYEVLLHEELRQYIADKQGNKNEQYN